MEGMIEVAMAYYERASEEEKDLAREFFKRMDKNGDGRVSLLEFKESTSSWLSNDKVFKQLDKKCDGSSLNFYEVLALYYMEKKVSIAKCDCCDDLLVGPYFSCLHCFGKGKKTYDLCCNCYRGGEFNHNHSSANFLDHHSLLMLFRERMADQGNTRQKGQMEGIEKIAIAYHRRASKEEKDSAREFFKRLDKNADGKVNHLEFKQSITFPPGVDKLFKKMDVNGDGTLDFDEVLALRFMMEKEGCILKCDGCDDLLVGPYFSCLLCLGKSPNTYDLCCDCYGEGKFKHEHSSSNFLDHLALLHMLRNRLSEEQNTPAGKGEMEGIKKLAKAYYGRASEEEMNSVREYFKRLDKNGDGKVNHLEFKESVRSTSGLSDDKLFKKFDVNGDGTLDFDEVLALHYLIKKEKDVIPTCKGCGDLLVGPYFSCRPCLEKSPNTYDLCCDCYGEGKFTQEHSLSNFLDHLSLLEMFRNRLREEQKPPGKKEMEKLHEIARAHYQAASKQVQDLAHEFFDSMDSDSDGQIDDSEFLAFMREQGHHRMHNNNFFKELDRDGNGTLDFWEVMTLYYIIKSGRPFCDSCENFIPGIFYSCVECYSNIESSFTLCHDCYRSTKCNHNHNGRTQFLDNYTLLQAQRDSPQATGITTSPVSPQDKKWGVALKALDVALAIGNISATACTIL